MASFKLLMVYKSAHKTVHLSQLSYSSQQHTTSLINLWKPKDGWKSAEWLKGVQNVVAKNTWGWGKSCCSRTPERPQVPWKAEIRLKLEVSCRLVKLHHPCHPLHIDWLIASFPITGFFSKEIKQKYREVRLLVLQCEVLFILSFHEIQLLVGKSLKWSPWVHNFQLPLDVDWFLNEREICITKDKKIEINRQLTLEEMEKFGVVEEIFLFNLLNTSSKISDILSVK